MVNEIGLGKETRAFHLSATDAATLAHPITSRQISVSMLNPPGVELCLRYRKAQRLSKPLPSLKRDYYSI
jgi:hypothetical protein